MAYRIVNVLLALVVRLGGVLDITGVFNRDIVVDLWRRAVAFLEDSLGDTHDCCGACESAIEGRTMMKCSLKV